MEERNILTAIETLAAEINLLRYDNERLREENESLRKAMAITIKVAVEDTDDE